VEVLLCGVVVVEFGEVELGLVVEFLRDRRERPVVVESFDPVVLLVPGEAELPLSVVGIVESVVDGEVDVLPGVLLVDPGMPVLPVVPVLVPGVPDVLPGVPVLEGVPLCEGFVGVVCCANISELPRTIVAVTAVMREIRFMVDLLWPVVLVRVFLVPVDLVHGDLFPVPNPETASGGGVDRTRWLRASGIGCSLRCLAMPRRGRLQKRPGCPKYRNFPVFSAFL